MSHLSALQIRLSNERARLAQAKTQAERELRAVWVAQIEKEIADEAAFAGVSAEVAAMSDDDLMRELGA